jgi:hypothetical protein
MLIALAQFFITPLTLTGLQKMLLSLPLCLSISIVYKTTRVTHVRELPWAVLGLWLTIVVGMYLVGLAVWVVFHLLA